MVITIQNDAYGAEEKLSAVEDGAKRFENLLKTEFSYVSPGWYDGRNLFENIKTGDKLVMMLGNVLRRWQKRGETLGRFVLYFHGHGVQVGWMVYLQCDNYLYFQVDGHPCLLTTSGEAVPMEELVNKVVELSEAEVYYIINDSCANTSEFKDEATKQRVRDAHAVKKDQNIVQIKAVPDGKRAEAAEGKTLTSALVAILEWEGRGVPLNKLQEELRAEQRKQGSKNVPIIEVSDEFAHEPFPL